MPELARLTWTEVRDLIGRHPELVAVLPVGATEAHGPHLPLGTDVLIAEAMARAGAVRLAAAGVETLLLPPIAYSPAEFAADFAGTVGIGSETAALVVADLGRALARHGVRWLAIANAHLDPGHIGALASAAASLEGVIQVVFPDVTRRPWATRLTAEFKSGACHAGCYEGSLVLAIAPELVRTEEASRLPNNPASLSVAIRTGKRSFLEAGGAEAYFGSPSEATAAEGEATLEVLAEILAEAVLSARQH